MEIIKIGKNTWRNAVILQIRRSFFTTNVFYCTGAFARYASLGDLLHVRYMLDIAGSKALCSIRRQYRIIYTEKSGVLF